MKWRAPCPGVFGLENQPVQSSLPQRATEVPRLWDMDGIASFLVRPSEDFLTQAALRIVPEAPPASPGHMLAVGGSTTEGHLKNR